MALFGLGVYHGINPAMGWLFAVALGLQEKNPQAVFRALIPIALGHALSVGAIVAVALMAQASLPPRILKIGAALVLFGFGGYRFFRARHPNWVGMRVGFRDLTLWSFIMASAHGAGLMLIPLLLGASGQGPPPVPDSSAHRHHLLFSASQAGPIFSTPVMGLLAAVVHTLGHLLTAGLIAWLVYEKFGLTLLSKAWINFDFIWVLALMATGLLLLFL